MFWMEKIVFQTFWSISFWTRRGLRLVLFTATLPALAAAAAAVLIVFLFLDDEFGSDSEETAATASAVTAEAEGAAISRK